MNDPSSIPLSSFKNTPPVHFAQPSLLTTPLHTVSHTVTPLFLNESVRNISSPELHDTKVQAHAIEHVKQPSSSAYSLHVGTGADFNRKGKQGLDKTLSRLAINKRVSFSGVSANDRKILGDVIEQHARHMPTGSHLSPMLKRAMKESIQRTKESGEITTTDSQKFKKIINLLD